MISHKTGIFLTAVPTLQQCGSEISHLAQNTIAQVLAEALSHSMGVTSSVLRFPAPHIFTQRTQTPSNAPQHCPALPSTTSAQQAAAVPSQLWWGHSITRGRTALPTPHTAPQHQCATRRRQMKTDHRDGGLGKITSHVVAICCLKPCWQSGLLPTASWPILACQRKEKPSSLSLPATRDLQLNTSSGQSAVEGCKEHQGLEHLFCGGRALGQLSMEAPVTTLWCPVIL